METQSAFVILTVPHAECRANSHKNHTCDFKALEAAQSLSSALSDLDIESIVLRGDINRTDIDLNRIISRYTTEFRESVRREVNLRSRKQEVLVLDIHSYPEYSKWGKYPTVFLYSNGRVPVWADQMGVAVSEELRRHISIFDQLGRVNDIQDEMHELGVKAILLEFNEANSRNTLLRITRSIAKSIKKQF